MNPLWQQKKLREYCKEKNIHVTAYSPLGGKGTLRGTNLVMDSKVLKHIALAKEKSLAQVCLRWVYQQGAGVLVKSFIKERMKENLEIFDWELTTEECVVQINEITQLKGNSGLFFTSDEGHNRSDLDLWDKNIT